MKKILKPIYNCIKKYYNILKNIIYKYQLKQFYKNLVGDKKLIFDIGANNGEKTKIFNKLGNKVIAAEPQNKLSEELHNKFINNSDVTIVKKSVGAKIDKMTLFISTRYPGFSSFDKNWHSGTKYNNFDQQEIVEVTTLDNLIAEFGLPHFCKIDVEGHELEVIKGLSQKIPIINIEFHAFNFNVTKQCLNLLEKLGYKNCNFTLFEKTKYEIIQWVDINTLNNIIQQKINLDNQLWGDIYMK